MVTLVELERSRNKRWNWKGNLLGWQGLLEGICWRGMQVDSQGGLGAHVIVRANSQVSWRVGVILDNHHVMFLWLLIWNVVTEMGYCCVL